MKVFADYVSSLGTKGIADLDKFCNTINAMSNLRMDDNRLSNGYTLKEYELDTRLVPAMPHKGVYVKLSADAARLNVEQDCDGDILTPSAFLECQRRMFALMRKQLTELHTMDQVITPILVTDAMIHDGSRAVVIGDSTRVIYDLELRDEFKGLVKEYSYCMDVKEVDSKIITKLIGSL